MRRMLCGQLPKNKNEKMYNRAPRCLSNFVIDDREFDVFNTGAVNFLLFHTTVRVFASVTSLCSASCVR